MAELTHHNPEVARCRLFLLFSSWDLWFCLVLAASIKSLWVSLFVPLAISDHGNNRTIAASHCPFCFTSVELLGMYRRRLSTVGHISQKSNIEPDIASVLPPSPSASAHSIRSSMTLYEHGDCIPTERISMTRVREETVESKSEAPIVVELPKPRRPKGHYRLSDFIMQRTLGTGSFGRVHLGM